MQSTGRGRQKIGWALLLDISTPQEEQIDLRTRELHFDIPRLASRLARVPLVT
jgi:hypothetical protein